MGKLKKCYIIHTDAQVTGGDVVVGGRKDPPFGARLMVILSPLLKVFITAVEFCGRTILIVTFETDPVVFEKGMRVV